MLAGSITQHHARSIAGCAALAFSASTECRSDDDQRAFFGPFEITTRFLPAATGFTEAFTVSLEIDGVRLH
jgi:hypothetical protein